MQESSATAGTHNHGEVGLLDLVTCPLCDGHGKLSRKFLYEKLGVRDMAAIAGKTAEATVTAVTEKLWQRYSENLTKEVLEQSEKLTRQIDQLKEEKARLDAGNKALADSIADKERIARETQRNADEAGLLKERTNLQGEIASLKTSVGKLTNDLSNANEDKRLQVQAATQDLSSKLSSAELLRVNLESKLSTAEQELAAFRAAKLERDKSTKGGIDFEIAAGAALRDRIEKLQDAYEDTRNKTGGTIRNSKVGDHVQTLSPDSKGRGNLKVVYECKKEAGYTRSDAFKELAIARENRQAEVGVLIMAAATVRSDAKVGGEFASPFTRFGNDLIVVWDHDDPATDIVLDVVVSAARALALRDISEQADEVDWTTIDKHLNGLVAQLGHFVDMKGWCGTIHDRTKDIEERLRIMEEQIRRDCSKLKEQLEVLRP